MRAFLGVELPAEVRRAAARAAVRLAEGAPGLRLAAPGNLHLTLAFLGEVEEERALALTTAVGSALQGWSPFTMQLQGGGRFPVQGRPRVVWIGVGAGGSECLSLAAVVAAECGRFALPVDERPFHSHITVGRARERARERELAGIDRWVQELGKEPLGPPFEVGRVVLFESTLAPQGPIYEERGEARFGGP